MRRGAVRRGVRWLATVGLSLASVVMAQPAPPTGRAGLNADVAVESRATSYRFEDDGTGLIHSEFRFKALTAAGRAALGRFPWTYDQLHEDLRIERVCTVKPDGRTVLADPANTLVGTAPVGNGVQIAYKILPAVSLEVGDSLEVAATSIIKIPVAKGEFWAEHAPLLLDRVGPETVVLDLPRDRAVAFWSDPNAPPEVTTGGERRVYRWTLAPPPVAAAPVEPVATFAVSTFTTWQQLGDWFLRLQRDAETHAEKAHDEARQLTAGATSEQEKAEALYSWVSRSVRYLDIGLGANGFQPHRVDDIVANGYGDCKDKVALFAAMLASVGVDGLPALVSVEGGLRHPQVPIPSEFDHVVMVVTLGDQRVWTDPSLEVARMGQLLPVLRGSQALLIRPAQSALVTVPQASASDSRIEITVTGTLSVTGKLAYTTAIGVHGEAQLPLRLLVRAGGGDATTNLGKASAVSQLSGSEVEQVTSSDPLALDKPFTITYQAESADYVNPLVAQSSPSLPSLVSWAAPDVASTPPAPGPSAGKQAGEKIAREERRRAGAQLGQVVESIDIALPPGYSVELPIAVHTPRSALSYDATYEIRGGHLIARRVFERDAAAEPAAVATAWATLEKVVDDDIHQPVVFRPPSSGEASAKSLAALSADDLNTIGLKAIDTRDFEAARVALLQAVAKDPQQKFAWNNLGRAYLGLQRWAEAEAAFRHQVAVNSLDQWAFNNLGEALRHQQRYREADAAYRAQLAINPFDPSALFNLGRLLHDTYHFNDAVEILRRAQKALTDKRLVTAQLAHSLWEIGDTAAARAALEEFTQIIGAPKVTEEQLTTIAMEQPGVAVDIRELGAARLENAEAHAQRDIAALRVQVEASATPDTDFRQVAMLATVAADLDRVGQARARNGHADKALASFEEAFAISLSYRVAEHLANLEAEAGRMGKALRYEALVRRAAAYRRPMPPAIAAFAEKTYPDRATRESTMNTLTWELLEPRRIAAASVHWPAGALTQAPLRVVVRVAVAASGKVLAVEALQGRDPWRKQALADARRLQLPPLRLGGVGVPSSRTLDFVYSPPGTIMAVWGYGLSPMQEFWTQNVPGTAPAF